MTRAKRRAPGTSANELGRKTKYTSPLYAATFAKSSPRLRDWDGFMRVDGGGQGAGGKAERMRQHIIPDHPIIANMERTGYPDGKEPNYPHCPFCDGETGTFYKDHYGEIVGCDGCVSTVDAWEERAGG